MKDKVVSFTLTEKEHLELVINMARAMLEDKIHYTISSYTRKLVVSATNGKRDTKQDAKQDNEQPAKEDTKPNAFSDLNF